MMLVCVTPLPINSCQIPTYKKEPKYFTKLKFLKWSTKSDINPMKVFSAEKIELGLDLICQKVQQNL